MFRLVLKWPHGQWVSATTAPDCADAVKIMKILIFYQDLPIFWGILLNRKAQKNKIMFCAIFLENMRFSVLVWYFMVQIGWLDKEIIIFWTNFFPSHQKSIVWNLSFVSTLRPILREPVWPRWRDPRGARAELAGWPVTFYNLFWRSHSSWVNSKDRVVRYFWRYYLAFWK